MLVTYIIKKGILNMSKNNKEEKFVFQEFDQIKKLAQRLKLMLELKNIKISIAESLEIVAKQFGYKNYNTMIAIVQKEISNMINNRTSESLHLKGSREDKKEQLNSLKNKNKKKISYVFLINNEVLNQKILKEIEISIQKTKEANVFFEYKIINDKKRILVDMIFDSSLTTNLPYELQMIVLAHYKSYIVNEEMSLSVIEKVDKEVKTTINKKTFERK